MLKMKKRGISSLMLLPIFIGLVFTMLINGFNILFGGDAVLIKYVNILNNSPIDTYPSSFIFLFSMLGLIQLAAGLTISYSLIKLDFFEDKPSRILKWGLLFSLFSVALFGFMLRMVSNHGGAANLYFYLSLLYFLLWYMEKRTTDYSNILFNRMKVLPIYLTVSYTMGYPGWQKIFNTNAVMNNYKTMFNDTFLGKMPGGVEPFIYLLGVLEISVPIFMAISFAKKELIRGNIPFFYNTGLLISISTFIMLAFGLSILVNYPGSTNLIFYAVLTFGFYLYTSVSKSV